jgi:hypothetical protein
MAGGRGKKIHVNPADVERLARKGHQQNDIAQQLHISHETYYQRVNENPDIAEAYKKGRDAFLEYIRKTRAERVLEALDELIMQRHPAAVIFASKTILGLQETVTHNHTAAKDPVMTEERLKELEQKRQALIDSSIAATFEKEPDTI